MRIRTLLILIVLLLVAGLLALNWPAITMPAKFNLLLTTIDAPVGLVMLAALALIVVSFGAYIVYSQGGNLLAARRHAGELRTQRALAEQAETSRLSELRELIRGEFAHLDERLTHAESGLRTEIRDAGNALAATIGELDDRLRRGGGARP